MKRSPRRTAALRVLAFLLILVATPFSFAATPKAATAAPKEDASKYQSLVDAANAVVTVRMKALANARSSATLGDERIGSGVAIAPSGLVLPIGYLILEADSVEL